MNLVRFYPMLVLAFALTSCQSTYTHLRVSNHRDEVIAEWIARGPVIPIERGYRITAVERRSGPPLSAVTKYPDGWRTTAVGPHIWRWRCPKPAWLVEMEEPLPAAPASVKVSTTAVRTSSVFK